MAFSFGSSTASFGASSAPAFGAFNASSSSVFAQSSAPATFSFSGFGASSAAAFGASNTPAFGVTSSAFGAPAAAAGSTPSLFGASTTSSLFASSGAAFGAASTPSLFGSSSAFGAPKPAGATGGLFSFAQSSPSLFSFSSSQTQTTALATFANPAQPAADQPLTYNTKWEEIPPPMQQKLLELQNVISTHRGDCEVLDKDARLHDSVALKKSLEEEASGLKQSFVNLLHAVKVDEATMVDFRQKVMKLIYSTEAVARVFNRSKAWREYPQKYKGQQQVLPASLYEELTAPVVLPSPFLEVAVEGFKETVDEYHKCVAELEQALPHSNLGALKIDLQGDITQTLPLIISNLHEYFLSVAADLERLHNKLQFSKSVFLEQQRQQGNFVDPFEEARRQRHSKLEMDGFQRVHESSNPSHTSTAPTSPAPQSFGVTATTDQSGAAASAATLFPASTPPSLFSTPAVPPGGGANPFTVSRQKSSRSKKK